MLHYWQWFGNHFWQFCCIFIKKIFSYQPVNADKPNFVSLLVIAGAAASFTSKILSFETVAKRGAILNPKTVNIQGYSELREPIRTHVNRYPLIWWILIVDNLFTLYNKAFLCTSTLESQVYESSDYIRSKMIFLSQAD